MQLDWGDLTPETFLREYWQKKPLLLKSAFKHFEDPISPDELAGLAMEEEIESRIVSHKRQDNWQLFSGPFEGFEQFGESSWTLLVQAVNNWSPGTHELLTPFQFMPSWRIDDVMVSFSTPEGGVGPHLDQYDVFIIQGQGKRRWQVGLPDATLEERLPHPDLKQVSAFKAVLDEVTEPGDLLYIPPNHPHNGVAIENSLNYSIGFQAPNTQDLWSAFADKLLDENKGLSRLNDAHRQVTDKPELLAGQDIDNIKSFMLTRLEDDMFFNRFIGNFLTQSHHAMEVLIPVTPITDAQLHDIFSEEDIVMKPVLGMKSLLIEEPEKLLCINGENLLIEKETEHLAALLASKQALTTPQVKSFLGCLKNSQLLTNVLNKGYWYIE